MAAHLHTQIRAALATKLTGLATTASRVYANRLYPMDAASLPGLRIYADSEEAETLTVHAPPLLERRLSVVVEACAKAASGLDDSLDQISKEVETALAAGITVGSRTLNPIYSGMSYEDDLGDVPVGVKRMTFSILFEAAANAPDTLA